MSETGQAGIDSIAFETSRYTLDLSLLAEARGVQADKFRVGLGQYQMAVPPPDEDIVTLGARAARRALRDEDSSSIEMLLFATESGIDHSKAAGIYIHQLLNLPERCRVVELKQACYSATCAMQLALPFLREHPEKKILLVASDIARYGPGTPGESSQGCGAVAMVLSLNPRILVIEPEYGVITEDVMDFWRPVYSDHALVEGKYSSRLYLAMLEKTWQQYRQESGRDYDDHDRFCYHTPIPRLVEKAHRHLAKIAGEANPVMALLEPALAYGRRIGNSYTASLYVGLAGLLDLSGETLSGKRIGFYSYGSGCVAEYFSGRVQPGYHDFLDRDYHAYMLEQRHALSVTEYETFYHFSYPRDGSHCIIPQHETGGFRLAALQDHKRIYETALSCERAGTGDDLPMTFSSVVNGA